MISQNSRKIIVAAGMAAVVGIGVAIFALRPHPVTAVVAQKLGPTAAAAETPAAPEAAAPEAVAPTPDAARADAQVPDAPAAIADDQSVRAQSGELATRPAKPRLARTLRLAEASTRAAAANVATTATDSSPTDEHKPGTSTELGPSDSQITANVKSEIASDDLGKDANIGVATTDGVVALTGSLASRDAIDHVKDVVGKVKDVKSVDTSALTPASP